MHFFENILKNFPHETTPGQRTLFQKLDDFFLNDAEGRSVFILKGYAGTGKTTVVASLVKTLPKIGFKTILLAPTGRAAKVLSQYSAKNASTIHRKIYKVEEDKSGELKFIIQKNTATDTVFLVDEASMINDEAGHLTRGLLHDLIEYIFSEPSNKLILIGDQAQLPPVGSDLSPALDIDHISGHYFGDVASQELQDVMRQEAASGILFNATNIRNSISHEVYKVKLKTLGYKDSYQVPSDKLEDGLSYAYKKFGRENVLILTRSNKDAVNYNKFVRYIRQLDSEIEAGDSLMVVKNNYTLLDETSQAGFIANGDFMLLKRLRREEELAHGFRFATVSLEMIDYPDEPALETKICLDTLYSNAPSLSQEENKRLYESVAAKYAGIKAKRERTKAIKADEYFNALQVKFAYALTCHKSQGGQWDAVFIDHGYLPEGTENLEFYRWLYTAITRASKEVYFINFDRALF